MSMMKMNLRMNLFHFLNKPFEEEVIEKLEIAHKDNIKFYLSIPKNILPLLGSK